MREAQSTIEKITKAKEEKQKEIDSFVSNIQERLNGQLKNKLKTLIDEKSEMAKEIDSLDRFHQKLNRYEYPLHRIANHCL